MDLYALVERYSGPGRASGSTVTYSCPNPGHPDYSPSFTVSRTTTGRQSARCWSACDWHGDALELVKWLEGCDTGEAARKLRAFLGEPEALSTYSAPIRKVRQEPKRAPLRVLEDTTPRPTPERAHAFMERYLEWRAWPADIAHRFALEVVLGRGGECLVRHPYLVPSGSGECKPAYWQDRGTSSSGAKWLSPSGASPVLYNLPSLESDTLDAVVLTEGPADAITASLALEDLERVAVLGIPGASAWRPEWAELVEGLRVILAADNDEAGRKLEEKVSGSLSRPVTLVRPSHGDLTDTYQEIGLAGLRDLLHSALGDLAPERSPEIVLRLERVSEIEGGARHE